MADVSIITVNYNTSDYLKKCVNSVIRFTEGLDYQIYIVDNNSRDRNELSSHFGSVPSVNIIYNPENKGFGAACNAGAASSEGPYLLFLNPDIEVTDNSIKKMYDYMEENKSAGLCSALLTDSEGKPDYTFNYFPSYSWEFREAFGLEVNRIINKLLSRPEISGNAAFEVDWNHGACLLVRREIFEEIKGFDENFFLYYEDTDLQFRIKKNNHKIFCLPFLRMIHAQRSSVRSDSGRRIYLYYMHLSRMLFLRKNYGAVRRNIIRSFFITGMFLRLMFKSSVKRINLTRYQIKMILSIYLYR